MGTKVDSHGEVFIVTVKGKLMGGKKPMNAISL